MIRRLALTVLTLSILACGVHADLMKDSPVKFPKKGALPSKFPPDVRSKHGEAPEKGYYLFTTPQRSLEQIAKIQAEMPKGKFAPIPQDWTHLARTRKALTEGGNLCILAIGDSIVNDTMRSGWVARLAEAYPKAKIEAWVYVRGSGGCQHYKEEDRVAKVVLPRKPDLVIIGGISQRGGMPDIQTVIHQIRAGLPNVEFLLTTGVFGRLADPRFPEELATAQCSGTGEYGKQLKKLAAEEKCAYLDMTTPWAEYVLSAGGHPHQFYRDVVHANPYGEQILCKILMAFFAPTEP